MWRFFFLKDILQKKKKGKVGFFSPIRTVIFLIYSSMPISQQWKHREVTFGAEKDYEKSALNWHKPVFTYSLYSIESLLLG